MERGGVKSIACRMSVKGFFSCISLGVKFFTLLPDRRVLYVASCRVCFEALCIYFQVEFLCERGADVNRGLRSSSLHYAACFGRPQIVKVGIM